MSPQCLYYFVYISFHYSLEAIKGEAYPMVGQPALGKVVGTNTLTPVPCAHHAPPFV